jgi:hypothetical protein
VSIDSEEAVHAFPFRRKICKRAFVVARVPLCWHETLYGLNVLFTGSVIEYLQVPVVRYGHCNFEPPEVLLGFAALVAKVSGQSLANAEQALPTDEMRQQFRALALQNPGLLH